MAKRRGFGSVKARELKSGARSYLASFINPDTGKRVSRSFHSKMEANVWLGERRREISIPPALVPVIKQHLNDWEAKDPTAPVFPRTTDPAAPVHHNTIRACSRTTRNGLVRVPRFAPYRAYCFRPAGRNARGTARARWACGRRGCSALSARDHGA